MALYLVGTSPHTLYSYEPSTHMHPEIILNTEGTGMAHIDGVDYPYTPGTIFVIPAGIIHNKEAEEGFRDIFIRPTLPGSTFWDVPHVVQDDANHTAEKLFSMIMPRFLEGKRNDEITNRLLEALFRYLEEWCGHRVQDPIIDRLTALFRNNFYDPEFSVTNALLETGYSKDHIRRRFLAVTGMTPTDYITAQRIRYAKQLLSQKPLHMSIGEISLNSGYYDSRYFSRIFQKVTGKTPTEYIANPD